VTPTAERITASGRIDPSRPGTTTTVTSWKDANGGAVTETDTVTITRVGPPELYPTAARSLANSTCVPGVSYYATFSQTVARALSYSVHNSAQMGWDPCHYYA
jgi:hypothetical protein